MRSDRMLAIVLVLAAALVLVSIGAQVASAVL